MTKNQPNESRKAKPGSPWPRVFVIISCFLLGFLAFLFWTVYTRAESGDPWVRTARDHLSATKGENALGAMVDAMESVDWIQVDQASAVLESAALNGWPGDAPELEQLLTSHQTVFDNVSRAASIPVCDFPETAGQGINVPKPDIERVRLLALLLVVNARYLAEQGREEEALQRLIEAAVFGARFTRPYGEVSLSAHLAGIAALELTISAIGDILRSPELPSQARQRAEAQLASIAALYVPIREALLAEADIYTEEIIDRSDSTARLAEGLRYYDAELSATEATELAESLKADTLTFFAEQERVWITLSEILVRPVYEQPEIDRAWFTEQTNNRLVQMQFADVSNLIVREGVLLARLRLAKAIAALGSGGMSLDPEAMADPFSPNPLRLRLGIAYSIGPDGEDQFGETVYNPSRGVYSSGDIVVALPASVDN